MDPNSHQYLRFTLELLSFISNFVLACLGAAALYQIVLAKRSLATAQSDIDLRSKREAVTLAADKCAEFAKSTLPEINKRVEIILNAGVKFEQWELVDVNFDNSSLKDPKRAAQWEQKLKDLNVRDPATEILNLLEAFAMYFAKGAADEQVAYSAIGPLFREFTEILAPHLIVLKHRQTDIVSGPFQNIATLYEVWLSRAKREELQLEANRIKSELSVIHESDIPPIGTKRS